MENFLDERDHDLSEIAVILTACDNPVKNFHHNCIMSFVRGFVLRGNGMVGQIMIKFMELYVVKVRDKMRHHMLVE